MLTVYRSNRAELLAQVLAAQLRQVPPDPFETVQVVVNTWPTSRWLGEQLAIHLGGIVANVRFPFPGSRLRQLVDQVLADPPSAGDPWRAEQLVWPVLELLPRAATQPEGEPLRRWLGQRLRDQRLELGTWQMGRAIADAFDDYALYRPELLTAWDRHQDHDGFGRALPPGQTWQPMLYRALRQHLGREPFALRVRRAIAQLGAAPLPADQLPEPLRLFGLSSMAPIQLELLQALSRQVPVDLYLLTPCQDLWQRCYDRRRQLSDALALQDPFDSDWLLQAPGLEARFGRMGSEFQQLLEGTGVAQLGQGLERDLFFAPATASLATGSLANETLAARSLAPQPEGPPPLLSQLQQQLADASSWPQLTLGPGDHSLEFHPCPGPLRQVQIVRDRLLQLLARDSSLQPRDILVMTPQVDRLAPLLVSVFGDSAATGVELPWRLTDRSQQSQAGLGPTLLLLLELAGERLTASGLEAVLECRPLQQRFDLSPEEASQLTQVLQTAGFRWGLDGQDRGGNACHSLAWAIDRLLLGLVLPEEPGLAPADTAPLDSGAGLELSGRWLHLLHRLQHWLGDLRHPCAIDAWASRLQTLLLDLFGDGGDAAWELSPLLAAIEDWRALASGSPLDLESSVVAAVLAERLTVESGRFGHRSGALTISALEPMRAIPYRVIVLMGLDADVFPRQQSRPGFHLLEHTRLLGDPHPADQDRYVLMEALLSARDHLLICWSCRDERKGEDLPPATPVRQWLDWLQSEMGDKADGLICRHAANPLDRRNFAPQEGRPPASCDRRLLASRRLLDQGSTPPPRALAFGPMPAPAPPTGDGDGEGEAEVRFKDLRSWVMEPQRHWLNQLGMRPGERSAGVDDLEAVELDERQRAALLRAMQTDADPAGPAPGAVEDWLTWSRGRGLLPALAGGELEAIGLQRRWSSLRASLDQLGPAEPARPMRWKDWQVTPLLHGGQVVVIHTARAGAAQRMDLWLQLLLAVAADPSPSPHQGVLIARHDKQPDQFAPMVRLQAPPIDEARAALERLAALRDHWRAACWPVPPRTGLQFLQAEAKGPGRGAPRARETWEGSPLLSGERQRQEMVVCFGADLPSTALLSAGFPDQAASLYGEMLRAQVTAAP